MFHTPTLFKRPTSFLVSFLRTFSHFLPFNHDIISSSGLTILHHNDDMAALPPGCLPAYRGPGFDKDARVRRLQKMLDDETVESGQRQNLLFAIDLYNSGEYDGVEILFIQDGKRVPSAYELHKNSPWWMEVS